MVHTEIGAPRPLFLLSFSCSSNITISFAKASLSLNLTLEKNLNNGKIYPSQYAGEWAPNGDIFTR